MEVVECYDTIVSRLKLTVNIITTVLNALDEAITMGSPDPSFIVGCCFGFHIQNISMLFHFLKLFIMKIIYNENDQLNN